MSDMQMVPEHAPPKGIIPTRVRRDSTATYCDSDGQPERGTEFGSHERENDSTTSAAVGDDQPPGVTVSPMSSTIVDAPEDPSRSSTPQDHCPQRINRYMSQYIGGSMTPNNHRQRRWQQRVEMMKQQLNHSIDHHCPEPENPGLAVVGNATPVQAQSPSEEGQSSPMQYTRETTSSVSVIPRKLQLSPPLTQSSRTALKMLQPRRQRQGTLKRRLSHFPPLRLRLQFQLSTSTSSPSSPSSSPLSVGAEHSDVDELSSSELAHMARTSPGSNSVIISGVTAEWQDEASQLGSIDTRSEEEEDEEAIKHKFRGRQLTYISADVARRAVDRAISEVLAEMPRRLVCTDPADGKALWS
ncbi:hypothetical protein BU15DRAFT_61341 [Melanogaster broomeanus]|nr:hypothetical protein BU15DRAFT_61341 [Melanogaster broomeanus]